MTLKRVSLVAAVQLRNEIERELEDFVAREMRSFLNSLKLSVSTAIGSPLPNVLLAAGGDEMPTMGDIAEAWATHVDQGIIDAVRAVVHRAFARWTDQGIEASSIAVEATNRFVAQVRDRLVRGTHYSVTVYEESYNKIRQSLALSAAEGWSRDKLAQHIAAELSWEKNGPYWRSVKADADKQIDTILDAIGEPGTVDREWTKKHDPRIKSLQTLRNEATKHLDAEQSVWKTRAQLIARTEATGSANFGAHTALVAEGVATKEWVATNDTRTRATHQLASGEEVPLDQPFVVGGSLMMFPGDPNGPVEEVANCRCALIGGDL